MTLNTDSEWLTINVPSSSPDFSSNGLKILTGHIWLSGCSLPERLPRCPGGRPLVKSLSESESPASLGLVCQQQRQVLYDTFTNSIVLPSHQKQTDCPMYRLYFVWATLQPRQAERRTAADSSCGSVLVVCVFDGVCGCFVILVMAWLIVCKILPLTEGTTIGLLCWIS